MQLFRSEEHVETWCRDRGAEKGGLLSLDQLWGLARAWYGNRLSPSWRRRSAGEAQDLFTSLGLTGDFWQLT